MNKKPINLKGLRVLNTRPLEQGKALCMAIAEAGGVCIDLPALTIEPTPDDWLEQMPDLLMVKHAIFISTNAVNYYFKLLETKNISWPDTIQVTAIGCASAAALTNRGIHVDHIPTIANSEHLLQLDALQDVRDQTLLLIKGEGGRTTLEHTLHARGACLVSLSIYRRTLPKIATARINSLWHDDKVDIILFTSQQGIHNIFTLFGKEAWPWLCSKPCLVISNRLADEAFAYGLRTIFISSHDTILSTLNTVSPEPL